MEQGNEADVDIEQGNGDDVDMEQHELERSMELRRRSQFRDLSSIIRMLRGCRQ